MAYTQRQSKLISNRDTAYGYNGSKGLTQTVTMRNMFQTSKNKHKINNLRFADVTLI